MPTKFFATLEKMRSGGDLFQQGTSINFVIYALVSSYRGHTGQVLRRSVIVWRHIENFYFELLCTYFLNWGGKIPLESCVVVKMVRAGCWM